MLLVAALGVSLALPRAWGGQQSPSPPTAHPNTTPATAPSPGKTSTAKPANAPAQGRNPVASAKGPQEPSGKGAPSTAPAPGKTPAAKPPNAPVPGKNPAASAKGPQALSGKSEPSPAVVPVKAPAAEPANPPAQHKSLMESAKGVQVLSGKRDPFKLPPEAVPVKGSGNVVNSAGGMLPPGPRGLVISQLKLEGVVRELTDNKMIAVVTNETKRAYFLTENETVYNGVVSKITPDSVYFKENVLDVNGHVSTREVVKRLNPAPGEER